MNRVAPGDHPLLSVAQSEIDEALLAGPNPAKMAPRDAAQEILKNLASRYERQHKARPNVACLIKAGWARALRAGDTRPPCGPPKAVDALAGAYQIAGVYAGLYCNPSGKSVHTYLGRDLEQILREAPVHSDRLTLAELTRLLKLERVQGATLCERAALFGTDQDVEFLVAWLLQPRGNGALSMDPRQAAMSAEVLSCALHALLEHCGAHIEEATQQQVKTWAHKTVALLDAGAGIETRADIENLAKLASRDPTATLLQRLPVECFSSDTVYTLNNGSQRTLLQLLLLPKNGLSAGVEERVKIALEMHSDPFARPAGTPSVISMVLENSSSDVLGLLLDSGDLINAADPQTGETAIRTALRIPSVSESKGAALLIRGADLNLRNRDGWSAIQLARQLCTTVSYQVRNFRDIDPRATAAIRRVADTFGISYPRALASVTSIFQTVRSDTIERVAATLIKLSQDATSRKDAKSANERFRKILEWVNPLDAPSQRHIMAVLQIAGSMRLVDAIVASRHKGWLKVDSWRWVRVITAHLRSRFAGMKVIEVNHFMAEFMDDLHRAQQYPETRHACIQGISDFRAVESRAVADAELYPLFYFLQEINVERRERLSSPVVCEINRQFKAHEQTVNSSLRHAVLDKVLAARDMRRSRAMPTPEAPTDAGRFSKVKRAVTSAVQAASERIANVGLEDITFTPLFDDEGTVGLLVPEADAFGRNVDPAADAGASLTQDDAATDGHAAPSKTAWEKSEPQWTTSDPAWTKSDSANADPAPVDAKSNSATSKSKPIDAKPERLTPSADASESMPEATTASESARVASDAPKNPAAAELETGAAAEAKTSMVEGLRALLMHDALNDPDLEPLQAVARQVQLHPTFFEDPAAMVERSLDPDADGDVEQAHLACHDAVEGVLGNGLLINVILGEEEIGEDIPERRIIRRQVARSYVRLMQISLGDELTRWVLEDDARLDSSFRKLLFRVAPDKQAARGGNPVRADRLFKLVGTLRDTRTRLPAFGRTLRKVSQK